jgi:murein DD-endopeptidase MepM/ murein hydrolase activator NlpD
MLKNGRIRRAACVVVGIVAATLVPAGAAAGQADASAVVNAPDEPLNVRTGPGRGFQRIGTLDNGTAIRPVCQTTGQVGSGTERRTDRWNRLPGGGYVSDGYVRHAGTFPVCGPAGAAATAGHWTDPLPGLDVQGGFRSPERPDHLGVDIMAFPGTPVRAAADGVVLDVVCEIEAGGSCDHAGSPESTGCGWYVKLAHPGGVATLYCHLLRRPTVHRGQRVRAGDPIGLVGTSGRSSFPHLHFEVHVGAPPTHPWNAVDPLAFMAGMGVRMPTASGR